MANSVVIKRFLRAARPDYPSPILSVHKKQPKIQLSVSSFFETHVPTEKENPPETLLSLYGDQDLHWSLKTLSVWLRKQREKVWMKISVDTGDGRSRSKLPSSSTVSITTQLPVEFQTYSVFFKVKAQSPYVDHELRQFYGKSKNGLLLHQKYLHFRVIWVIYLEGRENILLC